MRIKFIAAITSLCDELYTRTERKFARFEVDAHGDALDVARAVTRGVATDVDVSLAAMYAGDTDLEVISVWATGFIGYNLKYVQARARLANLHKQTLGAVAKLTDSPDSDPEGSATKEALGMASVELATLVDDDPELTAWLQLEIKAITIKLGLHTSPGGV